VSEWISVDDKLPKTGIVAIAFFEGIPVMASREDDGWHVLLLTRELDYALHGNYGPFTPTHWTPLPSPPQ